MNEEAMSRLFSFPGLTIKPYGVRTFVDNERGRTFTTLCYRHKKAGPLANQLAHIADVLADIERAGLTVSGPVKPVLSPGKAAGEFSLHLEVPISGVE